MENKTLHFFGRLGRGAVCLTTESARTRSSIHQSYSCLPILFTIIVAIHHHKWLLYHLHHAMPRDLLRQRVPHSHHQPPSPRAARAPKSGRVLSVTL